MVDHHRDASVGVARTLFDRMSAAEQAQVRAQAESEGVDAIEIAPLARYPDLGVRRGIRERRCRPEARRLSWACFSSASLPRRRTRPFGIGVLALALALSAMPRAAHAQGVEDASDAAIGKANAAIVLDLIRQRFVDLAPKVTALRKADGLWICGSVNVKNREGLYSGERGFVVDLSTALFGRVPEGPELLNPRVAGFQAMEEVRQTYFRMCLD